MLPMIGICGHPFFVDLRLDVLRPMDNFLSNGINLSKGTFGSEDEQHRFFYYHKGKMEDIDPEMMPLSKKIALVRIPAPVALDPVMTAMMQEEPIVSYLEQWPMVMYREAEAIALPVGLIRVLADRRDLYENPEKLFTMGEAKRKALTAIKRGKHL